MSEPRNSCLWLRISQIKLVCIGWVVLCTMLLATACSTVSDRTEMGEASWYGPRHHGRITASGQVFSQYALTAAHPTLPFGSRAKVTNLSNGKTVVVTINDRGPYKKGRIIDLSRAAARKLDMEAEGKAKVSVETLLD